MKLAYKALFVVLAAGLVGGIFVNQPVTAQPASQPASQPAMKNRTMQNI
jgi:hypothetical protein